MPRLDLAFDDEWCVVEMDDVGSPSFSSFDPIIYLNAQYTIARRSFLALSKWREDDR
jgi:hypothetical protein